MYLFEFDQKKSLANLAKHGIDFIEAQRIWDDPDFIEVKAKSDDELRFMVIGRIDKNYWSGIVTYREEKIRIISVRLSRQTEVMLYES